MQPGVTSAINETYAQGVETYRLSCALRRLQLLVVLSVVVQLFAGAAAAGATSVPRIEARLQQTPPSRAGTFILVGRRRVSAQPVFMRVNGSSSASAFTLTAADSPSSTESWTSAPLNTPGFQGLASAYGLRLRDDRRPPQHRGRV
jgi:hypothetical protein